MSNSNSNNNKQRASLKEIGDTHKSNIVRKNTILQHAKNSRKFIRMAVEELNIVPNQPDLLHIKKTTNMTPATCTDDNADLFLC